MIRQRILTDLICDNCGRVWTDENKDPRRLRKEAAQGGWFTRRPPIDFCPVCDRDLARATDEVATPFRFIDE